MDSKYELIKKVIEDSKDISFQQKEQLLKDMLEVIGFTKGIPSDDTNIGLRFFTETTPPRKSLDLEGTKINLSGKRGSNKRNATFSLDLSKTRSRSSSLSSSSSDSPIISPSNNYVTLRSSPSDSPRTSPVRSNHKSSPRLTGKLRKNKNEMLLNKTANSGLRIPVNADLIRNQLEKFITANKIDLTKAHKFSFEKYELLTLPKFNDSKPNHPQYFLLDREQRIGKGSAGELFAVFDLNTGELLCGKIFKNDFKYAELEKNHLLLVNRLYGVCKSESEYILVMKYYPGVDMLQYLYTFNETLPSYEPSYYKKRIIPQLTQLKIARGLLEQLAFFHKKNLILRDLKPANIIINEKILENTVEVTIIDLDSCLLNGQGDLTFSGSRGYTPPEILEFHGCGYLKMKINPTSISFDNLKTIIKNNHALILYDDQLFYADKFARRIFPIEFPLDTKHLLDEFPIAYDVYKEADITGRKNITKLTGRSLKKNSDKEDDLYQCGIIIAEMVSSENYQSRRLQIHKNQSFEQELTFEEVKGIMSDVFVPTQENKDKIFSGEQLINNLIRTVLINLAKDLTNKRLKPSFIHTEISKLKQVESLSYELTDKLNNLYRDTAKAHASLTVILEQVEPSKLLIESTIIAPFIETAKLVFKDIFPTTEDDTVSSQIKFK